MDLVARIKGLLLNPREEWQRIAAEPGDAMRPFTQYAVPVSALPVLAGFVGGLLFSGLMGGMMGHRPGFFGQVFGALLAYGLGLAGVFILAKLVGFLAPKFGGSADEASAMKLAAYAPTASWIAGKVAGSVRQASTSSLDRPLAAIPVWYHSRSVMGPSRKA